MRGEAGATWSTHLSVKSRYASGFTGVNPSLSLVDVLRCCLLQRKEHHRGLSGPEGRDIPFHSCILCPFHHPSFRSSNARGTYSEPSVMVLFCCSKKRTFIESVAVIHAFSRALPRLLFCISSVKVKLISNFHAQPMEPDWLRRRWYLEVEPVLCWEQTS